MEKKITQLVGLLVSLEKTLLCILLTSIKQNDDNVCFSFALNYYIINVLSWFSEYDFKFSWIW